MTIPHLMNCSHSVDSWCLDCVKEEWELNQAMVEGAKVRIADLEKERDELQNGIRRVLKAFLTAPLSDTWWMPDQQGMTVYEYLWHLLPEESEGRLEE